MAGTCTVNIVTFTVLAGATVGAILAVFTRWANCQIDNLTDKSLEEKNSLLILSIHVIAALVLVRKARISKEAIDIGYKE